MEIHVPIEGRGDRTERVYRHLRDAVLDGRLRRGERLPATRELAQRLGVSRSTVSTAYERLTAEGYLVARVGSGTFVAAEASTPGASPATAASTRAARASRGSGGAALPAPAWRHLADPLWAEPRTIAYDFSVGSPDPALFPLEAWRRNVAGALRGPVLRRADYADPSGLARLREGLARHLGLARSVSATADEVIVTSGAQQAFDLLGRTLLQPGDTVAVEDPGYPPVRQLLQQLGARIVPVPVDEHGLRVDLLPAARLVYVTPSHQFPLGGVLSLERRTALLAWARRHDAVVIEDDYDSEYRFGSRALDPLQRLDADGRVVYVGTFSKTMLPGLRLGFVVAPPSLVPALRSAKRLTDWHNDVVTQTAMARLLDSGAFAAHVKKASRVYERRHDLIGREAAALFAGSLDVVPSAAGLHLALRAVPERQFDSARVEEAAGIAGVAVQPLPRFAATAGWEGLLLGFGAIAADDIPDGIRLLAEAAARVHPA